MASVRGGVIGADRLARRFLAEAAKLPSELQHERETVGQDASLIFAQYIPVRSGRAARGIGSQAAAGAVVVTAHARNPDTGFDYIGVTRFGHKVARIHAKRAKALRIPLPGGVIFRRSVRGFRPAGDWRDRALPSIRQRADLAMGRFGARLAQRLS